MRGVWHTSTSTSDMRCRHRSASVHAGCRVANVARRRDCNTRCEHVNACPKVGLGPAATSALALVAMKARYPTGTPQAIDFTAYNVSAESTAPTVSTLVADAGDVWHASEASLPAAATTPMPCCAALSTARLMASDNDPPSELPEEGSVRRVNRRQRCFDTSKVRTRPLQVNDGWARATGNDLIDGGDHITGGSLTCTRTGHESCSCRSTSAF